MNIKDFNCFLIFSMLVRNLKILTDFKKIKGIASLRCGTTFDNTCLLTLKKFFNIPLKNAPP